MFGDVVSNNNPRPSANGGTATAARPAAPARPQAEAGGYGTSSFGPAKPLQQVQPARSQATQTMQPQPAARPIAQPAVATQPAPASQPTAQPAPITALPPVKAKKASKVPLILTIVGVVVFVGGVAGLFIYALAGK